MTRPGATGNQAARFAGFPAGGALLLRIPARLMSFVQRLRYRLEYAAFLGLAGIVRALPLGWASWLSGKGWRLFAPLSSRHPRAVANVAACFPNLDAKAQRVLVGDMWETLGRTFGESFHLAEIVASDRISFDSGTMAAIRARPGGKIFCGLHMGNWELTAIGGRHAGLSVAGVYQRIKNPHVDAWVTANRAPLYPAGLYAKGAATAKALMRHVKDGGALGILADLRDKRGVPVPFFGRPAPSNIFPALLAVTFGLPLYACRVTRLPGVRFQLDVEEVPVTRTGNRDADIEATLAALQATFERYVRDNPGQWMWAHRRWG